MSEPMPPIKLTKRDAELLALHAEDLLTPEQAKELNARLHADPALLPALAQFAEIEEHLRSLLDEEQAAYRGDWYEMMTELAKAEAQAEVQAVHLIDIKTKPAKRATEQLSLQEVGQALRYLGKQTRVWAPIAAVLILAVALAIVFSGGGEPNTETAQQQSPTTTPTETTPVTPITQPVATLTNTHNAQWSQAPAEGASAPGSSPGSPLTPGTKLHPNQRLTLTAGFAEITTNDGAIAILEAPATVELLNNDNALRLHSGKLVGLCYSDSSKGFVVKTDHADITDLGTEFGVEARDNRITTTVFTGEVTLTTPGGQPQPLTTHQTAKVLVNGNNRKLVVQDQLANGFNKLHALALTKTVSLPGTGQAIAVGQTDPNWRITALDGKALSKPISPIVFDTDSFERTARPSLAYLPNDPTRSQWISPLKYKDVMTSVRYELSFDLTGLDPASVQLLLRFIADKHVNAIHINETAITVPEHGNGPDFTQMTQATISEGLIYGQNTLALTVQRYTGEWENGYWTGLRAELELIDPRLRVGPNE